MTAPEEKRAEINESRRRVSEDLEQIAHRLNPHHIKDELKENIREATIGRVEDMARGAGDKMNDVRQGLMNTVRENPIPAAMAAIGVAWLFMNRGHSSSNRGYSTSVNQRRFNYADRADGYEYERSPYQEPSKIDSVKERAADIGEGVKEKVSGIGEQAQEVASRVAETGGEQVQRVEDLFYENPLAVGVAAVAVGLAAGLAAPATHAEAKLMGHARDTIVDKASEVARDTSEKAQRVAERAVEETKHAARDEGLAATS